MAFDVTKKRVSGSGPIAVKNADGSPMLDDDGNALTITFHGPGTKVQQAAQAEINRRRGERIRKSGGKIEAGMENVKDDQIYFLTAITISFDGWDYPVEKGAEPSEMFKALYSDELLGFIRDQMWTDAQDWASFMKG